MNKETLEVDDLKFTIKSLNMKQSLDLQKQQEKMNFFEFVENFIEKTTTLDKRQISSMKFQVAIAIMVYHRFYFWDNLEVSSEPVLKPKDFLGSEDYKEEFVTIGDYRFSNIATLEQMKNAEKLCYLNGELEYLNFYLLGALCQKSLKEGYETLLNRIEHNEENRALIKQLNNNVGLISNVTLDLLQSSEKLGIISNSNYVIYLNDSVFFSVFQD